MSIMNARFPGRCSKCKSPIVVGDLIDWERGAATTHLACPSGVGVDLSAPEFFETGFSMLPLVKFLARASEAGLKAPKIRFLAPDGKSELRVSVAGKTSKYPGHLNVKIGGEWLGRISPEGVSFRLEADVLLRLVKIVEDPAAAAKQYAALMGRCSFCNLPLTDDGSVDVGYGPICAKHYGLPHIALGVRKVKEVPA